MSLSKDEFKEWLNDDVNYLYSEQVPIDDIFQSIIKGQMMKYWKHVVRHIRSRNVAAHIRANLQLHKHRKEVAKNQSLTSTTLGHDQMYDEDDLDREELKKDFQKCERRLRRYQLELTTLQHETVGNQKSAFQLLKTLKSEEMEVLDQTRSAYFIDREADKYSVWVQKLDEQCQMLTNWIEFVDRKTASTTSNGLSISQIFRDLKVRLVEILQDERHSSTMSELSEFDNLLDSLRNFSPSTCKMELVSMLRDLAQKIDLEMNSAKGCEDKQQHQPRDPVKEAMVGLWGRHLESHSTWQKIQVEIEKWTERSDKSLEILQSSLSDHNPIKNPMIHHFKLIRTKACAEALLVKLRSQVGNLQSDTQSQVQTLGVIEQDFATVKQQSSHLERMCILVETMLVQATGLNQRVSLSQELIQNSRSNIKSGFMLTSTSLPLSLSRTYNLPMNFLTAFDETGFRPKVLLGSTLLPCEEVSIYRLSATNSELNNILGTLEVFYPANTERILQILVDLKNHRKSSEHCILQSHNLLTLFQSESSSRYKLSMSETLKKLLEQMKVANEKIMLTHPAMQGHEDLDSMCRRLAVKIDHWRNEPVKEMVKQDDRFVNEAKPVKPVSKWYQDFYSTS